MNSRLISSLLVTVLPLTAYLVLCWLYFPQTYDDGYITLRYARNFAHGHGLCFNTTGDCIEGYSNLSWLLLLAGLARLGLSLPLAMKWLSLAAGLGAFFLLAATLRRRFSSPWISAFGLFLFGGSSFVALWTVDGLETIFFSMLLVAATLLGLAWEGKESTAVPSVWGLGAVLALLCLTRPEGGLYAGGLLAALISLRSERAPLFRAGAIAGATFVGQVVFRRIYYGEWIPNSVAAKLNPDLSVVEQSVDYLAQYLSASGYLFVALVAAGIFSSLRRRRPVVPILVSCSMIAVLVSGGDYMWGYRYITQTAVIHAIAAAEGLWFLTTIPFVRIPASGFGLATLAALVVSQYRQLPTPKYLPAQHFPLASAHQSVAAYLNRLKPSASDILLLSEAGIVAFSIDMQVVDYLGLVTRNRDVIRSEKGTRYFATSWLLGLRPRYVLLTTVETADGRVEGRMYHDQAILNDSQFKAEFESLVDFPFQHPSDFHEKRYYFYYPEAKSIRFSLFRRKS
jgi:hypothetical protein